MSKIKDKNYGLVTLFLCFQIQGFFRLLADDESPVNCCAQVRSLRYDHNGNSYAPEWLFVLVIFICLF